MLDLFWESVPVQYLYLIVPGYVIFLVWSVALTLLYRGVVFLREGKVKTLE